MPTSTVSKGMVLKIAQSGLGYDHMRLAFNRKEEEGLRAVLMELVKGKSRVTKEKGVLDKIGQHFASFKDTTT